MVNGSPSSQQAILWDYDGTLADTVPSIVSAHHYATEAVLGIRLDESAIRQRIGEPARRRIHALVPSRADEVFTVYSRQIERIDPAGVELFGQMVELVSDIGALGHLQGVVTSRPREQVLPVLRYHGLLSYFGAVIGLEDTPHHKPHPEPLLKGMAFMDARLDRSVYVGDAVVDIAAARAADITGIAVTWGAGTSESLLEAGPDAVASSARGLRSVLIGLASVPEAARQR